MRLSEPITIYLAAGAPFGVSRYLCAGKHESRLRALLKGTAATLLWPLVGAAILFKRLRLMDREDATEGAINARVAARVEEAGRAFMVSVNVMLEALRRTPDLKREEMERTLYTLRDCAEQYVGLAGMQETADLEAPPAAHELELARISGRRGDDLLVAGRCAHRRNVARIRARYERERSRLLQKLAELRALEGNSLPAYIGDADLATRRQLSEARLEIYLRVTDLCSLLEDADAARQASRLLNAECSYLRRLQEKKSEDAGCTRLPGEERCIEQPPQLIYKDRLTETTFTQG